MPILASDLDAGNQNGYTFTVASASYIIKTNVVLMSNFVGVVDAAEFDLCWVVNNGTIIAGTGIYTAGDQVLVNNGVNGEINATTCIAVGGGENAVISNYGVLAGLFDGINISDAGRTTVINAGAISAIYAIESRDTSDVFIDNSGSIVGDFYSIVIDGSSSVRVANSGELTGTLRLDGSSYASLINSGEITGDVIFGSGADIFKGKGGTVTDRISGNDGNDRLIAGDDGEWFSGGAGNDTITGGKGEDSFIFDSNFNKHTNVDQIRHFSHADDTFELLNLLFLDMKEGYLASDAFKLISGPKSTKGVDASDRILYDKAHGDLYFDRDGAGDVYERQKFAHLHEGVAVDASDFLVA
ncbi:MAG: hemolysin-type calcium-binding repeat family protein [Rhizobium sp.]|nr:hemolysin-type calcium-binding repeat family protein [Rhizobium sp.]